MTHESREGSSSKAESPGGFPVCEKLRAPLSALVGSTGFGALISRSLALASREFPWLRGAHVRADGSLGGMAELETQLGPEKVAEGKVALIAQLLGLLKGLIGQNLTMRLMRDVWPELSLDDPGSMNGETDDNE